MHQDHPQRWRWVLAGVPAVVTWAFETIRHRWFEPVPHAHAGNLLATVLTGVAAGLVSWMVARRMETLYRRIQQSEAEAARRREKERLLMALHDDVAQRLFWVRVELDGLSHALASSALASKPTDHRTDAHRSPYPVRPMDGTPWAPFNDDARRGLDGRGEGLRDLPVTLGRVRTQVEEAYAAVRAMLSDLQPERSGPSGGTFFWHEIDRIAGQLGIEVQGPARPVTDPELAPPPYAVDDALGIVAEALHNVAKHAGTRQVEISVQAPSSRVRDGMWRFTLTDAGKGFDPDQVTQGLGLSLMRERAQRIGGMLDIWSSPGRGTRIVLQIPKHRRDRRTLQA